MSDDVSPGLLTRAGNFIISLTTHVAAGCPQADAETQAVRKALCDACEHRTPGGGCSKCGCLLSVKTAWAGEKCPLGRW